MKSRMTSKILVWMVLAAREGGTELVKKNEFSFECFVAGAFGTSMCQHQVCCCKCLSETQERGRAGGKDSGVITL